jgi:hypothetical protein
MLNIVTFRSDSGFDFWWVQEYFFLSSSLDRLSFSPSFVSNAYRRHIPQGVSGRGVKLTTHHLNCSAELKNARSYTFTFQYILMAFVLIKHRKCMYTNSLQDIKWPICCEVVQVLLVTKMNKPFTYVICSRARFVCR